MHEIPTRYRSRRCTAATCGLRFPVADGSPLGARCPLCGAPTEWVDPAYSTHGVPPGADPEAGAPRLRVEALLDNIRSLRNVGSMFRTADGAGLAHLYLGGVTPSPEHPKLAKTALGAERSVPWSRHPDACLVAAELCAGGRRLWALEGGPRSLSIFDPAVAQAAAERRAAEQPVVLVLGHEVSGVDPRIVDQCERVIHLPMMGIKDSLNVSVALGIAAYALRFGLVPPG
jgi:23S rRNA (guanosine2251-2'-O)-methyltransferase